MLGGVPGIESNFSLVSKSGIDANNAHVYGCFGSQKTSSEVPISTMFAMFIPSSIYIGTLEGKTVDGITLDKSWAINDGIVPLASALYPTDDAEKSFSYSETLANGGEIERGSWYYMDASGVMVTGVRAIGNKTYHFDDSGICLNP